MKKSALVLAGCALAFASVAAPQKAKAPQKPVDTTRGEFYLPPIFSDHAVLQAGVVVPIWGEGPNSAYRISCRVGGVETWAYSDNGRHVPNVPAFRNHFKCFLPPLKAGGPYELVLSNETTHAYKLIRDVYVGEVWLASGQSNMAFGMDRAKPGWGGETNNLVRLYSGNACHGSWRIASPETVRHSSAIASFFGRELQRKLGGAVGILSLSCGGTLAENWMTRGALKACPATRDWINAYELGQSDPETWVDEPREKEDPKDLGRDPKTADWAKPDADLTGWVVADMPNTFRMAFGYPVNGAAWFRRTIVIPKAWAGKDLTLRLPAIDKHDITYFNDVEVGRMGKDFEWETWNVKRVYKIPAKLVKAGQATIAVRIWSWKLGSGFTDGAQHFSIGPDGAKPIELEGDWYARLERSVGNRGDEIWPKARTYPDGTTFVRPSSWYDKALKPVIPYAMKGAIWYQGESNARSVDTARDYREVLAALIADWRREWGLGDFPFGIVQLANFAHARRYERVSAWAELRDSQLAVSRAVPNTGLVSAIDLGEEYDIHPTNKLDVARRLCRWAVSEVYGKGDGKPYTGPRFLSGAREPGGRVRIRFTEAEGGLVATGPVTAAIIRGEDGVWHDATVVIDGETLILSSPEVPEPQEVRYAWSIDPIIGATLKGKATGIPVFPFRWTAWPRN